MPIARNVVMQILGLTPTPEFPFPVPVFAGDFDPFELEPEVGCGVATVPV